MTGTNKTQVIKQGVLFQLVTKQERGNCAAKAMRVVIKGTELLKNKTILRVLSKPIFVSACCVIFHIASGA